MSRAKLLNLNLGKKEILLWILAFVITIGSAVYQRMTGPTYPYRNQIQFGQTTISAKLLRSETTGKDLPIEIRVPDKSITGYVQFRRYKSADEWKQILMIRREDTLTAQLPSQPPSGKIMYFVFLQKADQRISMSGEVPVIARYKGDVPVAVLIPHVLLMFLAMLFSNRAAFEAVDRHGRAYQYTLWTIGFFLVGGFILGPLVQKYAFGELWTGIPFGYDLTDNKTLIAMLGWMLAWFKNRNGREGRGWILFAAILMLAVYLIPHSVLGSELDYTKTVSIAQ
jgi:hypothetical protein